MTILGQPGDGLPRCAWASGMKQAGLYGVKGEMQCTIVIEESPAIFAACAADLPGFVAAGAAGEGAARGMRRAILFHIGSLRENCEPVPELHGTASIVDVVAAAR